MIARLFLIAQDLIVDFQTKSVSAIHILENFTVASFPVPLQCALYSYIERSLTETANPDIKFEIKIGESQLAGGATNIVFLDDQLTAKNVAKVLVLIPTSGRLSFRLFERETTIAKFEVEIMGQNTFQNPQESAVPAQSAQSVS
jgi:hypothetical protein